MNIGPIWDFNLSFGNADYCGGERYDLWCHKFNERCLGDLWNVPFWWDRILEDEKFVINLKNRGNDLRYDITLELKDAFTGIEKEVTIPREDSCQKCKGSGAADGGKAKTCRTCAGQGIVRKVMQR